MSDSRPVATLSLDLDDLWTYLRTRGDPSWVEYPSYLSTFVPRVLDALDPLRLRCTFFIVGFDAARPANAALLRAIAERGHELANHSFSHECWMHQHSRERLRAEIGDTEEALVSVTGQRPTGFRGPGFSWSPDLLEVLTERGYRYDASTLPTFIGPAARLYFLATARLTPSERKQRQALFGSVGEGFRPSGAYMWRLASGARLLEIPTTTVPLIKLPFHMSYLLYLRRFSKRLMVGYLRGALAACRLAGISPSFLLHPLDLLSGDEVPALSFFPGMALPRAVKQDAFMDVLRLLSEEFEIVTMGALAERLLLGRLPEYQPEPLTRSLGPHGSELASGAPYSSRIDHAQPS